MLALGDVDDVALAQARDGLRGARDLRAVERPPRGVVARGARGQQPRLLPRLPRPDEVAVWCLR